MANAKYNVGDEATVTGVVVHVGSNGGNYEYTVAVNNPDSERPVSVPQKGAPQLQANGEEETRKLNAERYEEVAKETVEADKEADKDNKAEEANAKEVKATTPDPKTVPAGGKANTAAK